MNYSIIFVRDLGEQAGIHSYESTEVFFENKRELFSKLESHSLPYSGYILVDNKNGVEIGRAGELPNLHITDLS